MNDDEVHAFVDGCKWFFFNSIQPLEVYVC